MNNVTKTNSMTFNMKMKFKQFKENSAKRAKKVYETDRVQKTDTTFAQGLSFSKIFTIFVFGSFLGTILETAWAFVVHGGFHVRVGFVYGPFIAIYGIAAVLLSLFSYRMHKVKGIWIFLTSLIICSVFEYFCSYIQEAMFGTISWDYSDVPFNINGRVNLFHSLMWGGLGLLWLKFVYPPISILIEKIPNKFGAPFVRFLVVFFIFNSIISYVAVSRWNARVDGIAPQNVVETYIDNKFTDNRMAFTFPNMVNVEK